MKKYYRWGIFAAGFIVGLAMTKETHLKGNLLMWIIGGIIACICVTHFADQHDKR